MLKRQTTFLNGNNLTNTGLRLEPTRRKLVTIHKSDHINLVSHFRGLNASLLLLHLDRVQQDLNK